MPLRRRRLFQSAGATVALSAAGQVVGTSHTQAALPRARHHRLSTNGAAADGGRDAPSFPFRSPMQGGFLTAWAQAHAVLGDTTFRDKAHHMVAELATCPAEHFRAPNATVPAEDNGSTSNLWRFL
ncbi:hypothetical protein ACWGH8_38010 [Nonomuraea muscovyensis]